MKHITLYGAGGHCYAVIELIRSLGEYIPTLVIDHDPREGSILTIPVSKNEDHAPETACITIGDNAIRKRISRSIEADFPTFIHESVVQYPSVSIGKGTVVLPLALLDAAVSIGDFCIINNSATISHNVALENYVHIAINAAIAGGVKIGEGTLVGAGAVINPEINIGKWAIIGSGAIVTKDVPDHAVVYGNPAVVKRYTNE
ncbi:NeuD/PglB/VioB family sugar acetyltransferase [Jejudonia soesokkakensis]|uniref:NeuD/PglB/VioB family sugar acetyltransferase n=1 Tax=Jejudonia soesokkakensis TaxID=1323432 RepID=A0ABW2MUQ6_9FLAO